MKKVLLFSYDHVNLGDDLFVYTITNRYPNAKFYLWSTKKNVVTFRNVKNLKILKRDSGFAALLNKIRPSFFARYKDWWGKYCDAVVYIGGSIFIEYPEWNDILNWWEYAAENYSLYILGANFGPYHSVGYRKRASEIFGKADDVCFRDQYTYNLFLDNENVRYAPDILLATKFESCREIMAQKKIFISVIDCNQKIEREDKPSICAELYLRGISNLVKKYILNGFDVILASFCEEEGDLKAAHDIYHNISEEQKQFCSILTYDGTNMQHVLNELNSSEYILGSRFHSVILGFAAKKPVLPLIYSDKTIHVLQDVAFCGKYIDIRREVDYDFETSIQNLKNNCILDVSEISIKAAEHFRVLDDFLER